MHSMVVRTRFRSIFIPIFLFLLSGASGSYFVWHALNGERGLNAKVAYKAKIDDLSAEHARLVAVRERMERRIAMLQADQVDRDILEEEAKLVLGRMCKNDLMIMFAPE
jgi:cell division protein FtsB